MKIFIFEGIATSGKSTVINALAKSLPPPMTKRVYTEQFTHIPIKNKTNDLCKDHFIKLITEALASDYDVILFDRLYLSQAFRAQATLKDYLDIEMMLFTQYTKTIFLELAESDIADRISRAVTHRDSSWGKYVGTKGQTPDEQAQYYIKQQRSLSELLGSSVLEHETYDVSDTDYKWIVEDIKDKILKVA